MKIFHGLNICDKKKGNNLFIISNTIEILFFLISKIKNLFVMRFVLFLFFGIFVGLYLSWPGIVITENWKCFNQIIVKSAEDKISLKAALEISPSYFLKAKNKKTTSKIRIVADACFR